MASRAASLPSPAATGVQTLGVVSFLNALPLHQTLAERRDLNIVPAVPARLAEMLAAGHCDIALLPIVDYWRARDRLALISDACIASDGETMTVRVYAKIPPDTVTRLRVDGDSRTSIILARLVWLELYGRQLKLVQPGGGGAAPETAAPGCDDAVLLIGDKVVRDAPRGFGFEVDLGAAWKHITGLPFVFAAWYGAKDRDHATAGAVLRAARDAGVANLERLAAEQAPRHGWPRDVALRYLRDIMRYTLTSDMRAGMDRFFDLAVRHGLLPQTA